jgi:hypothetical protein
MSFSKRPLGDIIEIIEKLNSEISYVYDDLIFIDYSDYLLKFGDNNDEIEIFFNTECRQNYIDILFKKLKTVFIEKKFKIFNKGKFSIRQKDNEELEIRFYPE